jgi:tetratricopeptide (TPR) repeat protein
MPSLSALKEFRNSFSNIANEKENLISRNLPYTSPDLPAKEAPPFEQPSRETLFPSGSSADFSADSSADTGAGIGIDFSALLGSVPSDIPPPSDNTSDISFDGIFNDTAQPADDTPSMSTEDFLNSLGGEAVADETSVDEMSAGETSKDEASAADDFLNSLGIDTSPDEAFSSDTAFSDETSVDETSSDKMSADEMSADAAFPADDFLSAFGNETPTEDAASSKSDDDFSVPPDLLSGLSDEIESAPADFPSEDVPAEEFPAEDFPSEDFTADESPPEDEETLDLGGERLDGSLSTDSASKGFFAPNDSPVSDDLPDISNSVDALADNAFETEAQETETPLSDFGLPDGFESDNFGADTSEFDTSETEMPSSDFELSDTSVSDTPVLDTPVSGAEISDAGADKDDEEGIELDGESRFDEEDIDLGGESLDNDSDTGLSDMDFNTGESPSGNFEADSGDFMSGTGMSDMDFDTTEPSLGESSAMDSAADDSSGMPDMADFGADFASESIELETETEAGTESETTSAVVFSDDDFALPGLDDIFEKSKIDTTSQSAPKKSFFRRKKVEVIEEEPESEDSDEIQLSQADVDKLLATLSSYPLNLRVACEELIAEQVILPQQLSKLLRLLIRGAPVKEMAEFAGQIIGREIVIPRSYEKSTGAEWEAEKSSFAYIFVNNFLPVLKIFAFVGALLASTIFLSYKYIYIPVKAELLYKRGYERIGAGEYQRADELFHKASAMHRKKKWFYLYAEGFRDQRRYLLSENKYDELLRYYPRDKKGVLDYAQLETYYLLNYDKANRLLQHELLDYAPNDYDGLLASGDNFLAWADSDPVKYYDKYEDARFAYARILQNKGWTGPVLERMMLYFIRTDNLKETLNMRAWFENNKKKYKLSTPSLAELGGYLLDKQLEKVKGVRDAYVESIESVRDMLLQAVREDHYLPEPHYHLARYYNNLGNIREERLTLENAIRAYDLAQKESVRRRLNRVDTHYRYANLLINNREFFPAEEQLVRGIELYEDFVSRNLIAPTPQLGQLYSGLGDLEYFVKSGNIQAALNNYHTAERYGWSPPEIQYRMGAAYYQQERWGNALDYLFKAASELPQNRRILFALGNAAYKRGDYFAAQGYYNRLLDILENQRVRLPVLFPNDSPQFLELGERLMMARNNAGVVYEALAKQAGRREYRSRALALYADSARAWDSITRNPKEMTRMTIGDTPGAPGINLGYLNANNALHPSPSFTPEIFIRIDKDVLEPSKWEELAPFGGLID